MADGLRNRLHWHAGSLRKHKIEFWKRLHLYVESFNLRLQRLERFELLDLLGTSRPPTEMARYSSSVSENQRLPTGTEYPGSL